MAITKAFAIGAGDTSTGNSLITGTFSSVGYTHLVVFAKHEGATATINVSDNKGSTGWQPLTKQANNNSDSWGQFHWVKIGTPGTGHTVTMAFGSSATRPYRTVLVWLVNASSAEIAVEDESTASNSDDTQNPDAGSLVTTVATVSFMGVAEYVGGVTYTQGSGWSEDWDGGGVQTYTYGQSRADASGLTIDPVCTDDTNQLWAACAVSFKESTAGATPINVTGTTDALSISDSLGPLLKDHANLSESFTTTDAVAYSLPTVGTTPINVSISEQASLTDVVTGQSPLLVPISEQASWIDLLSPQFRFVVGLTDTVAFSEVVYFAFGSEIFGLEWPGNGDVRRMLYWLNPFPIYDATYIFRVYPRKKVSETNPRYYTTFFWGNNGTFTWDSGSPNTYYGAHPYPVPPPNGAGQWEISVNSGDETTGVEVTWDRWHVQAFRAWRESASVTHHEFYYDLPDITKLITVDVNDAGWADTNPPTPAIVMGQAPDNGSGVSWGGYEGWEEFKGIIRGIQIYSEVLSVDDILAEIASPKSTTAGANNIWYLNLNPRPSDVTDKKGTGTAHDGSWEGTQALEWKTTSINVNAVAEASVSIAEMLSLTQGMALQMSENLENG